MPVLRNADHPAGKGTDSVVTRYGVAVLGSWAAEAATYPFDLTKTRLQIQSEVAATKHGYKLENHGMVKTAVGIVKQEGVLKLWSGLVPMFQRHAIYSGCRLIFYEHFRNTFKDDDGKVSLAVASVATYPFDLTKTRLQIQSEVAATKHGYKLENHGMVKTAVGIVKQEGVLKLWSGLVPMFQRHAIYSGCRLIFYEHFRNTFKDDDGKVSLAVASVGGLAAGSLAQLIASPTDLVKVQMQAEGRRLLQGKDRRFQNCRQVYGMLYAQSGIRGFWRGAIPNVQRAALVNMGDLAAYDCCKQFLLRDLGMDDTALVHAAAAFTAGFVAAVVGTPADVIKTRLMNQPVGPDGRGTLYRGMMDCLQQSVKNEGLLALYNGFLPLWMRLGPWALINWMAFENIMIAIGGRTF